MIPAHHTESKMSPATQGVLPSGVMWGFNGNRPEESPVPLTREMRQRLPPEWTGRSPGRALNRVDRERLALFRRKRAGGPSGSQQDAYSLPCQRHGGKLRQSGGVLERPFISSQQDIDAPVQKIPRVAVGGEFEPNEERILNGDFRWLVHEDSRRLSPKRPAQ